MNGDHDCVTKQTHAEDRPVGASCAKFVRLECLLYLGGAEKLAACIVRQQ